MTEKQLENIWKEYPNLIGELPKDFSDSSWINNEFPSYTHNTRNFVIWVQDFDFETKEEVTRFYLEYGYRKETNEDISMYQEELEFSDWVNTWEEVLKHQDKWIKEYTKRFPNWKKEVK